MSASTAVAVRKSSGFISPRFRFLLGVVLLVFPLRAVLAAEPTMTLLKRESQPISEGKTVIRSQYRYVPPPFAAVQMPPTTVMKELVVLGCGVNYDVNRGVGQPMLAPSHATLTTATVAGVAFQSTASPLEFYLPSKADHALAITRNGRTLFSRFVGASADAAAEKSDSRTARYANVFADTDLVWQVGNGYLKESLILRSPKAPREFSFALQSSSYTFLSYDSAGKTTFPTEIAISSQRALSGPFRITPRAGNDANHMIVPTPMVVDATGWNRCTLVCNVARSADGSLLYRMRIPDGYFKSRSIRYPLMVDPTYVNVTSATAPAVYEAGKTYYI